MWGVVNLLISSGSIWSIVSVAYDFFLSLSGDECLGATNPSEVGLLASGLIIVVVVVYMFIKIREIFLNSLGGGGNKVFRGVTQMYS